MSFVVVYDACVLYPAPLRDLLLRLARTGLIQAKWTEQILDECFRNILENRKDLDASALARTRTLMNEAVPDCLVTGYERLIDGLELPDAEDRHVLAAAIKAGAQAIVTLNVRDFPPESLEPYAMEGIHPDDFVLDLIDLAAGAVCGVVVEQARDLRNPPRTLSELLDTLRTQGLIQSVARLRDEFGAGSGLA